MNIEGEILKKKRNRRMQFQCLSDREKEYNIIILWYKL